MCVKCKPSQMHGGMVESVFNTDTVNSSANTLILQIQNSLSRFLINTLQNQFNLNKLCYSSAQKTGRILISNTSPTESNVMF